MRDAFAEARRIQTGEQEPSFGDETVFSDSIYSQDVRCRLHGYIQEDLEADEQGKIWLRD